LGRIADKGQRYGCPKTSSQKQTISQMPSAKVAAKLPHMQAMLGEGLRRWQQLQQLVLQLLSLHNI
jgi:hypothetical protein